MAARKKVTAKKKATAKRTHHSDYGHPHPDSFSDEDLRNMHPDQREELGLHRDPKKGLNTPRPKLLKPGQRIAKKKAKKKTKKLA